MLFGAIYVSMMISSEAEVAVYSSRVMSSVEDRFNDVLSKIQSLQGELEAARKDLSELKGKK